MARRRRRNREEDPGRVQRDDYSITRSRLLDGNALGFTYRYPEPSTVSLLDIEDRRRWDPEGDYRPARSLVGPASVIEVTRSVGAGPGASRKAKSPARGFRYRSPFYDFPAGKMEFRSPERVIKCVRRGERREVLFAKRKTGKGSKAPRTRDYWSDVSCGR